MLQLKQSFNSADLWSELKLGAIAEGDNLPL